MAGPTKKSKRKANDESIDQESEPYNGQQEIEASFEGRYPEAHDFHGIKQLLNQLFLKAHIDISQMTDLLIAQQGLGSVLKQSFEDDDEDDDDDTELADENNVFCITSVINLTSHKETPCVQQFCALLEEMSLKHASTEVRERIKKLVNESKLGFLINERFVNIPAKVSTIMLNNLYEEVEKLKKKDASYNFDYYVMISKTCRPKENTDSEEIFSNDEEKIFSKEADISFDFSVANESDTGLGGQWLCEDKQVVPYRRIVIFKASKLKAILTQVSAFAPL